MTGKEVLQQAMELMLIPKESLMDYTPFLLPILNGLLPELYSVNELVCFACGVEEEEIPSLKFVRDISEEIPLRVEVAALLPYGVCIHLAAEDDDMRRAYYQNAYDRMKSAVSLTAAQRVKDVYW